MSLDDYDRSLFGEITKLVPMKILDTSYEVPERLELLRVFQFLDYSIDYSKLCWNGSCHRCVIKFEVPGSKQTQEALSCRQRSCAEMNVTKLPAAIKRIVDK